MEEAASFLSSTENWNRLTALIKPNLVPARMLKNCLAQADGAHRFQDIRDNGLALEKHKFLSVVKNANQMRERFTILDLAVMLGIIPWEIESLVKSWISE